MNVLHLVRRLSADWTLTAEELRQIKAAVANEAYPPRGRADIWSVVRKTG
jgi:hypothetical protein